MDKNYFVHESSYVDEPCSVGEGTKIWHFSHIMKDCTIGRNCNIGQNVVISPGVVLGNNVKIQNNVSVYTGVECEDDVFLGPSCVFTNVINPRSHVSRKDEYRRTLLKKGCSIGAHDRKIRAGGRGSGRHERRARLRAGYGKSCARERICVQLRRKTCV